VLPIISYSVLVFLCLNGKKISRMRRTANCMDNNDAGLYSYLYMKDVKITNFG
jgi:hypothetical protein